MEKINGLDLFSGIGGITIALSEWVKPVAYCERDRYAQGVLLSRMSEGGLPVAPIWDDVTTLRGEMLPRVDIIYGGFPCQDISVAGAGKGLEGQRSGLFFEVVRLAEEIKPSFIFLENVPTIRTRGLDRVIKELTQVGYDCRWTMLSAKDVGANHKRERWFLLAHVGGRRSQDSLPTRNAGPLALCKGASLLDGNKRSEFSDYPRAWGIEPNMVRVVHGVPLWMDRIKGLGNAVVPLQAKTAFEVLIGLIGGHYDFSA